LNWLTHMLRAALARMPMDPREVDNVCTVASLVEMARNGDTECLGAAVAKLQARCGRQATSAQVTTCEFGDRGELSALHTAAVRGRAEILRILLEAEANPNSVDDPGCGPLHHACERGHVRAAYVLLRGGADPDQRNNFGRAPRGYLEVNSWDPEDTKAGKVVIHRLLDEGLDSVNYDDLTPEPPQSGASPKSPAPPRASIGTGPYGELGLGGARHRAELLRDDVSKAVPRSSGVYTASEVSTACTARDINVATGRRISVSEAVRNNDLAEIRRRLAEAKAEGGREFAMQEACNLEEDGEDSRIVPSPLHVASSLGNMKALQILLATGASVNHVNDAGDSLLHMAASCGQMQVVEYLISVGAKVDIHNNFGRTPLELAKEEDWDSSDMKVRKIAVRRSICGEDSAILGAITLSMTV